MDSNEEWYAFAFFCELHDMGLVKDFTYQPESLPLTPKFTYIPVDPFGVKRQKQKFLFHDHVYTADFKVTAFVDSVASLIYLTRVFKISPDWIYEDKDTGRKVVDIWIDVKGEWLHRGAEFSINQKLVFQKYGIYINKFVPKKAFAEMGAPKLASKTPSGRPSKVFGNAKFIESVFNACQSKCK